MNQKEIHFAYIARCPENSEIAFCIFVSVKIVDLYSLWSLFCNSITEAKGKVTYEESPLNG